MSLVSQVLFVRLSNVRTDNALNPCYQQVMIKLNVEGTVRSAWKNNVSQWDIDLTFQTRKLWSKLVGYVVKRNANMAGDVQLNYQMQQMPRKETLRLEVSLANRSSKTLTHKAAELKLHSTAYPQLNTVITAWYQQALGHLELHADINSSPHLKDDRHKLTAQLIVSYSKMYFQKQDTRVNALIAITKPIQNLDIKVGINHYAMGPESKTRLLIGYAPGWRAFSIFHYVPYSMYKMHENSNLPFFIPRQINRSFVFREGNQSSRAPHNAAGIDALRGSSRESNNPELQFDVGECANHRKNETHVRSGLERNLVQRAQPERSWYLLGQIGVDLSQSQSETEPEVAQLRERRSTELQILPELQRR